MVFLWISDYFTVENIDAHKNTDVIHDTNGTDLAKWRTYLIC